MGINYGPPPIVQNGLVYCIDALDKLSYPGSGTTWSSVLGTNNTISTTDGTLTNSPTFDTEGYFSFNASDDEYVDLGDRFEIWSESPNRTLCMWIMNSGNTANEVRIFNTPLDPSGDKTAFALGMNRLNSSGNDNKLFYFYRTAAAGVIIDTYGDALNTTSWYHCCLTANSTTGDGKAYTNGVLQATASNVGNPQLASSGWDSNDNAKIAEVWFPSGSPQNFNGKVACVQLYNRDLTASEILHNFNAQRGRFGV